MSYDILIVSGRYPITEFLSAENHKAYASKFGYRYSHCSWPGKSKNPYFNKIEYILEHFDKYDYIFWIDDDAFFIDFEFDIASLIPNKNAMVTICSSPEYKSIWTYISSGQFMMRCCDETKNFLKDVIDADLDIIKSWWDESKYGFFTNGDQDAMVYLAENYYNNIFDIRPSSLFNSRLEDIINNEEVNILHITGSKGVKRQSIILASKYLGRSKNLIPNHYLNSLKIYNKKSIADRMLRKIKSKAKIKTLDDQKDYITYEIENLLNHYKKSFDFIFNPSVIIDEHKYVCFRAKKNDKISSYLCIDGEKIIDLTSHVKSFGVVKCSDPKFFKYDNKIYITFNTGYIDNDKNDIYIMSCGQRLGRPLKCVLKSRQRIEKNWAFWENNSELFCIYSLDPFICLKVNGWFDGYITLDSVPIQGSTNFGSDITIGTQAINVNGRLYIFAHKKLFTSFKRVYLGRLVYIELGIFNGCISINDAKISKINYCHNINSLFGDKIKLNKNLFSCTYFSSLFQVGDSMYVGYGVNDVQAKIRKISELL